MTSFPQAIRHCLRRLGTFRGRDTRSQFWFFVLGLVIAQQVGSAVVMVPLMFLHFGDAGLAADATASADGFASIMSWFVVIALALPVLAVALLAAAIVRRLHDRGLSGWWGVMPLPFLVLGAAGMYRLFSSFGTDGADVDQQTFAMVLLNNVLYLLTLLVLVILLIKESDRGPNRYGPPAPQEF
ncbi:DUF805 domain-containing protein [Sphingomonas sp.]|uniref:DUF805 domain-containing protein n=1 Tax=Sphingomonas sp. TaxID=28214 RepID=UPI003AFFFBAD